MRKSVAVLFYSFVPALFAGEINFSGIFDSFAGARITEQRKVEENLEENLRSFKSIASSRVIIPVAEISKVESLWAQNDAKMLPVEVTLKLKKRKRMLQNEYRSIYNLVSTALEEKNQMVQPVIRDEEGFEWSEDNPESMGYFKAAALESEIWERLKTQGYKEVSWTEVNVSDKDGSCKIIGSYDDKNFNPKLQIRRDIMTLVGDLCQTARISLTPTARALSFASENSIYFWIERLAYVLLGFAVWGFVFSVIKIRRPKAQQKAHKEEDHGAIILTKIVERNPDQAAKWMVRALLSESESKDKKSVLRQSDSDTNF